MVPCRSLCTALKDCMNHTAWGLGIIARMKKFLTIVCAISLAFGLVFSMPACTSAAAPSPNSAANSVGGLRNTAVTESGEYTDKDSVAEYIHLYGHLPGNYVSKTKARKAGWSSTEGNLWDVLPGKSIGGSEFYDDDDQLPDAPGRRWTECDIDYSGGYRNGKRIVFSNDGLIYYTTDHYKTFERLY